MHLWQQQVCLMVGHIKNEARTIGIEMVIYYKMSIKISLNTNIIQTLQLNVTNNNNVFDLQINVQCKQWHKNI